ncbi:MAG: hypothetical protein KKE50_02920 [Nanoarchaeota archaeon]|nr:hypothetical protein [Nanoarchaeota archaeon]
MREYTFYKEIDIYLNCGSEDEVKEETTYTCQPSRRPELGRPRDSLQQAFQEWAADFRPSDNITTIPKREVVLMTPRQHYRLRLPLSPQEMEEVNTLRDRKGK